MKRWMLVLGTLLLIGVGAAMPWAAAWFQDRYGVSSQETLPFDPVSLTLRQDSELGSVLRLLSDPYDQSDWSGWTRMTAEEASDASFAALAELDRFGLLESGYMGYYDYIEEGILDRLKSADGVCKASPVLYVSQDGDTAVIWLCDWKGIGTPSYELLIDDNTGMAVQGYIPASHPEDQEAFYQRASRWADFFQYYYEIEVPDYVDLGGDILSQFFYRLDLEDGEDEVGMIVNSYYFEMTFNPCFTEMAGLPLYDSSNAAVLPEDDEPGPIYDAN